MGDLPAKTSFACQGVDTSENLGARTCGTADASGCEIAEKRGPNAGMSDNLLFTYVLASIGFACLIGWELSAVFSPSLALLSFCSPDDALILRMASVLSLAATFAFCAVKDDWVFVHRNRFFTFGSSLALLAVLNTFFNLTFDGIPFGFSFVIWALFGFAQGSMMTYWCLFFSLIPTRGTAATIGLGSVCGTLLFVFANSGGALWANLFEIAVLIVFSAGLAAFLSVRVGSARALPVGEYLRSAVLSRTGLLSAACQGIVYGFMSIELCFMGPEIALLGGASGLFGTVLALAWSMLGPRVEITIGVVQRISLPLLVASLLMFPLFGDVGRIVCGCIANTTLAHSSVIAWYSTSIDNSEFRLHPVSRFAQRQVPTWVGFFLGTVIAYVILIRLELAGVALYAFMAALAVLVVAGFSLYSGDDSIAQERLDALLNPPADAERPLHADKLADGAEEPASESEPDDQAPEEWQDHFNQRCARAAAQYNLTPRETEVFYLLARGRNADYIAARLVVSPATVKSHIYHIYQKLGINSQQHLMNIVDESGEKES